MSLLVGRRLVEAAGIACIYGGVEKIFKRSAKGDEDTKHLVELKMKLANEGSELITLLHQNLRIKLKTILKEKTSKDIDIADTVQELTGIKIPNDFFETISSDVQTGDKKLLNSINNEKLKDIVILSEPRKSDVKSALVALIIEFDSIEDEILMTYYDKQRKLNDTITYLQSKAIAETQKYNTLITCISQIGGCSAFSIFLNKVWSKPSDIFSSSSPLAATRMPWPTKIFGMLVLYGAITYLPLEGVEVDIETDPLCTINYTTDLLNQYRREVQSYKYRNRLPQENYAYKRENIVYTKFISGGSLEDGLTVSSIIQSTVCVPITQAYIFRNILFKSLATYCTSGIAHVMTAVALSASVFGSSVQRNELYRIDRKSAKDSPSITQPLSTERDKRGSIPLRYFILQYTQYIANSALLIDIFWRSSLLFKDMIDQGEGLLKSADNFAEVIYSYQSIVSNYIGESLTNVFNVKASDDSNFQYARQECQTMINRIFEGKTNNVISTEEYIDIFVGTEFAVDNLKMSIDEMTPPPFNPKANGEYQLELFGDKHSLLALRLNTFTTEFEANKIYNGKVSKEHVFNNALIQIMTACITQPPHIQNHHPAFQGNCKNNIQSFMQKYWFWHVKENVTDEKLMDLIQELYAHQLEKANRIAKEYVNSQGVLYMLAMEGRDEVPKDVMNAYYQGLISRLNIYLPLEEIYFLSLFGLSRHRYNELIQRYTLHNSNATVLIESWEAFFRSEGFYSMLIRQSNPIAEFRKYDKYSKIDKSYVQSLVIDCRSKSK